MWNKPSEEELAKLPAYRSTDSIDCENKIIHMHFFIGGCDWYIAEYEPTHRIFFGFANLNDDLNAEWGDIPFDELIAINIKGMEVDRDLYWKPKPFKEIKPSSQKETPLPHTEAEVLELPNCEFCADGKTPATYDGKTTFAGKWAYMCEVHFQQFGVGLGLGKGQRLVVKAQKARESNL